MLHPEYCPIAAAYPAEQLDSFQFSQTDKGMSAITDALISEIALEYLSVSVPTTTTVER